MRRYRYICNVWVIIKECNSSIRIGEYKEGYKWHRFNTGVCIYTIVVYIIRWVPRLISDEWVYVGVYVDITIYI